MSVLILILGLTISIRSVVKEKEENRVKSDMSVTKNEWKEGDLKINLTAKFNEDSENFALELNEREYSEEELEVKYADFLRNINTLILGENESFYEVSTDLTLKNSYKDFPFSIHWESSDTNIIDDKGHLICNKDTNESFQVTMSGTCTYRNYRRSFEIEIRIIPAKMSKREEFIYHLGKKLDEVSTRDETEKNIYLPKKVDGVEIIWSEKKSLLGIWILIISVFLAVVIQIACDYDEKKKEKHKEECFRNEYPSFVEKLRLYVISGLTIKNAFLEIAEGEKGKAEGKLLLVNQLKEVKNKLQNGINEEKVYEEFGSSCSEEYRKLAFILIICLKQGNDKIIEVLEEEAKDAQMFKSQLCKKKADELGVKLLFPMTVMLILVMGLIMVPVYIGFY